MENKELRLLMQQIRKKNDNLGFCTEFFHEKNGIISYTENGTIYLNTFYDDIKLANKREILHHFERNPYFKAVKFACLKKIGNKEFKRLKKEYKLSYSKVYTEEEIKEGVIDTEIAIDVILNNGEFPDRVYRFAKNFYHEITTCLQKWPLGKRYSLCAPEKESEIEKE